MKNINQRILICNRGEIAIRIAKAIKELGFTAIGLFTESEPTALHLEYCHEWVFLPGKNNTETYLDQNKILQICRDHHIDAVHPGYGFLSENAKFAKLMTDNNIVFIGPNFKAIEAMGDKAKSKQLAKSCNVPVVPGSTQEVSLEEAKNLAMTIGFPILLKAVAGGGGKGMRICHNTEEIDSAYATVKREALSSFGYDGILIEKYILNPHHIEVQILADKKGNLFHLFERECSIQRRHQKIIEEAPSPFIGPDEVVRQNICNAALTLAKNVGYDSAGTVEFVMGEDKNFYFLEMNTRIQVEHPITEEITGIDLVINMIKAAFNLPLDISHQNQIKISGYAIECRICCEDPITMLPSPGKIHHFEYDSIPGSRFDHCIYSGLEIKSDFDPMIGKIISVGITREVALRKMLLAINCIILDGLKSNIPLLKTILQNSEFIAGKYSTAFISKFKSEIEQQDFSKQNYNINQLLPHLIPIALGQVIK